MARLHLALLVGRASMGGFIFVGWAHPWFARLPSNFVFDYRGEL